MAATKLLVIGDQIASALSGPFLDVAKKNGFEVRVDGRPGTTAADWIKNGWLATDINTIDPDAVLVVLGTNDAKAGLSASDVTALVAQGSAKKADVGWIAPLTGNDPALPSVRKTLADAMGDHVYQTELRGYARAADGVSLSPAGAQALASDLAMWSGLVTPPETGMSAGRKLLLGAIAIVGVGVGISLIAAAMRPRGR